MSLFDDDISVDYVIEWLESVVVESNLLEPSKAVVRKAAFLCREAKYGREAEERYAAEVRALRAELDRSANALDVHELRAAVEEVLLTDARDSADNVAASLSGRFPALVARTPLPAECVRESVTPTEDGSLIVDCSVHGEVGTVPGRGGSLDQVRPGEADDVAALWGSHVAAPLAAWLRREAENEVLDAGLTLDGQPFPLGGPSPESTTAAKALLGETGEARGTSCRETEAPAGDQLDGVQWIYHSGYYDGPLSGMVRLPDGTEVWADCVQECSCYDEEADEHNLCGYYRRYSAHLLTPERARVQAERHADFRKFVGTHTDHGRDEPRVVHPQERWEGFYDKWSPGAEECEPGGAYVGWFEL